MRFRVTFQHADETEPRVAGEDWEDMPDDGVQLVEILEHAGDVVLVAGWDWYFLSPSDLFGGFLDDPATNVSRGVLYDVGGSRAVHLGDVSAYAKGGVPAEAEFACRKSGEMIPDSMAVRLGLLVKR